MSWTDERPAHGIVLMNGDLLLCACGTEIRLAGKDIAFSQKVQYDLLLDRHATHKARRGKDA